MAETKVYISKLSNGTYKQASKEEQEIGLRQQKDRVQLQDEILNLQHKLNTIQKTCTHQYCYDTLSIIKNVRICLRCGLIINL